MVSSNRSRFIIALMLTWFVVSPYVISINNVGLPLAQIRVMEPAAPTITGPASYQFENGSVGETLIYDTFDANPKNYTVTVNASSYDSGVWVSGKLTVNLIYLYTRHMITALPMQFNFEVTVNNIANESASTQTALRVILDETAPIIQQHENITYEVGSFGHEINWNVTESNPDYYNVTRTSNESTSNYTQIASGAWNGANIVVDIDGLNASHWYLYALFVNDTFGRNATSSVNVTVTLDLTNPLLSSPDDILFEFGSKGHRINWTAYDSNPKNYTVRAIIHYNDTSYGNVSAFHSFVDIIQPNWSFSDPGGQHIIVTLDGLFLGNYTIELTAFDDFGLNSTDSVNVTIYKDIRAPVIQPADDFTYEEGYTGYNITWRVEESNPLWFNLTRNDEILENGTWRGQNFTIFVNGLAVGDYAYNLTLSDFFNSTSFAVIQVHVTPDAHNPIIANVKVIQSLTTQTTNNLTVQAYVWDLNHIKTIEVRWGIGNPEDAGFVLENRTMERTEIGDVFGAPLGEYAHGQIVWFRVFAEDNSSVNNIEETPWANITVSAMSYGGGPLPVYVTVFLLGGLSLLIVLVLYFRTRVK
ncbi:MAG: hypothetical protein C4K48_00270 [Candidatus Thorarchaeota archaeon]|nr:MAG: hypothetical protein C4K48_00270 [Candidatus Thorarchaeota archaeon]